MRFSAKRIEYVKLMLYHTCAMRLPPGGQSAFAGIAIASRSRDETKQAPTLGTFPGHSVIGSP
jgi:hypothetical protein